MISHVESYRSLYPFESHYAKSQSLRYHYLDEGQGAPVVMVHGNPTWSFYFRELIKSVRTSHRVIVPDHIGCGLSDKPKDEKYSYTLRTRVDDLELLLSELGINDNITLVAHDWGGMIALSYAIRDPRRIKRFVMMNTSGFLLPPGKRLPWQLWMLRMIPPFASFAVRGMNLFSKGATWMATTKGLPNDVKSGFLAPYDSWENRIAVLRFVQDIPLWESDSSYAECKNVEENLESLSHLPLMLCWGEKDFVFDMEFLSEWERRCPHALIHRFPDAGHYVLEDAREELIPLIQSFLNNDVV